MSLSIEHCDFLEQDVDRIYRQLSHVFEGGRADRLAYYEHFSTFFDAGDVVLDLGCGDGIFLETLAKKGISAFGVDRDPDRALCVDSKNANIVVGDLLTCNIPVAGINALSLIHVIEHFQPDQIIRRICQLQREFDIRKILIVTPNIGDARVIENFWLDITHVRPYPRALLVALLQAVGFNDVKSGYGNTGLDTLAFGSTQMVTLVE
ncbi:class I SAM-dependent methyltransferase [Aciditerrimonas ferrireducens]|uniref:Class I SAM-dependent methyltransferase n=1 Tax=Aciditerrimonas ferrireducens TaxID=667306 RepID=A0ABV6C0T0_9ACTN|nr:methyltransferase domain-containing protein [Aciditerrimonas ferrireducens]MCK4177618.1 class I SAM-dependent methyltransferase [Aciditerrimonas ferrireducens]